MGRRAHRRSGRCSRPRGRDRSSRRAPCRRAPPSTSGSAASRSWNDRRSSHAGHRVALHDAVGRVAAHAAADQREQHRLAEDEPVRRVEVLEHARGMHLHARDDGRERRDDVVREQHRVREDDALDRRVRDVALVPQRDVLERGLQVRRAAPAQGRRAARTSPGCACAASRSSPSARLGTAPRPRRPRCAADGGSRARHDSTLAPIDAHV